MRRPWCPSPRGWPEKPGYDILGDAAKAKILFMKQERIFQCPSAHFNPTANAV